jgi:hypothetical protein
MISIERDKVMQRLWNFLLNDFFFCVIILIMALVGLLWPRAVHSQSTTTYVGSASCKDCHENEFKSFSTYSKKAHSFKSIKVMQKKGITEADVKKCYECHTTGYGKPGGFRSESETPHLKDAGCEVCHGPGSLHVQSGSKKDIRKKMNVKECEVCHNSERVGAFKYKPLIYGGAH